MRAAVGGVLALGCLAGCDLVFRPAGGPAESDPDARAQPNDAAPFATPTLVPLGTLGGGNYATDPTLSADGATMVYAIRPSGVDADVSELFLAQRNGGPLAWTTPLPLPVNMATRDEVNPRLSPDANLLLFGTSMAGSLAEIEMIKRSAPGDEWIDASAEVASLNSASRDDRPGTPTAELTRIITYSRVGDENHVFTEYTRSDLGGAWMPVLGEQLIEVNVLGNVINPYLSPDGLTLAFAAASDPASQTDLYVARRPTVDAAFEPPAPLTGVNTPEYEGDPWLSADGATIYFSRSRTTDPAHVGVWYAVRLP